MNDSLYTLTTDNLGSLKDAEKAHALSALESGQVVYFPSFYFHLPETDHDQFLSESILDGKHKNISFDYLSQKMGGLHKALQNTEVAASLKSFIEGYALFSKKLVDTLFPRYQNDIIWGRTSYRPAEVRGRASSKRKDDTRLHVDSFAATPVNGLRILRVFCNINPYGEARVWHLGEPFVDVANKFSPKLPKYKAWVAKLLQKIKVTKSLRSAYDHYQLHLHDSMKMDEHYQNSIEKTQTDFPAQSTWLVFTDQVSHAALSGQYLLEQTFYLPVSAMQEPTLSPWHYWEREKSIS
jgi:hypothetical protein